MQGLHHLSRRKPFGSDDRRVEEGQEESRQGEGGCYGYACETAAQRCGGATKIIKQIEPDGKRRYDFQFENKRGYKTTVEGLSEKFNPEYWNYAKLISGVLRYRMPIDHVIKLVSSLQLKDQSINTWKNGVERALKKYVVDGTEAKGQVCPVCGHETLVYQEGCLICKNCGASRCG